MKATTTLAIVAILSTQGYAQTPAKKTPSAARTNPCAQARAESYRAGWDDGHKAASELAKTSLDFARMTWTTSLGDSAKPLKVSILVEEMTGEDSYRYAAADLIRTQFEGWLVVEPKAELSLYISGTDVFTPTSGYEIQSIRVSVVVFALQMLSAGKETHRLAGKFEFASDAKSLSGYSSERRTTAVREMVYKVLSEFISKWQESARVE